MCVCVCVYVSIYDLYMSICMCDTYACLCISFGLKKLIGTSLVTQIHNCGSPLFLQFKSPLLECKTKSFVKPEQSKTMSCVCC